MFKNQCHMLTIAIGISLMAAGSVEAQRKGKDNKSQDTTHHTITSADSTKKTASVIKPYKDVITADMKTSNGFILVHEKDDKYYFEVPNKVLGRDILIVSRISKASAEMRN